MFRRSPRPARARVVLVVMLTALPAAAQAPAQATGPGGGDQNSLMVTPTPVNGEGYSMEFTAENPRTNYVIAGLSFASAYDDNVISNGTHPVSDVSYSIWPTIGLDQSRSHLKWSLFYSPGFTFYQKNSVLNQADHNADLSFQYRLSPHVTLSVYDTFRKTSDALSQSGQNSGNSSIGGTLNPPTTVIAPVTDLLSNQGDVTLTYQFAANAMVGASGILSFLEYPNNGQAVGFANSHGRGGNAFYTHRFAARHYIGGTYSYQDLRTTQTLGPGSVFGSETVDHSVFLFYTFYLKPTISLSVNGGPEHSTTNGVVQWSPAFGGSFGWRSSHTTLAANAGRKITAGNGLSGACHSDALQASVRRQLSSHLTAGLGGGYWDNKTLGPITSFTNNGHTLSGQASLELVLAEHLQLGLGYTRLHQDYSNIVLAPDRDRVWASLSYQIRRPIGR